MKIGVDLGGTNLRAALVTPEGTLAAVLERRTHAEEGPEAVARRVIEAVTSLEGWREADFIGVGAPGAVRDGCLHLASNLPGSEGFPLQARLEGALGRPVRLENDGNVACLGEALLGAGRGLPSVVYLTVSTGIGGGAYVGGRLLRGAHGFAGEYGSVCVDFNRAARNGLPAGAAESEASGEAITRRAGALGRDCRHAGEAFEAARAGDAQMRALTEDFIRCLAALMSNLAAVLDPSAFVLGGGCMQSAACFWDGLTEAYRAFAPPVFRDIPLLRALLPQPGLVGAALLERS